MRKILFVGLFCCFFNAFAQHDVVVNGELASNTSGMWIVNENKSSEVQGSYYVYDEFHTGIITAKNGEKYKLPGLNYNLKSDQFEAKISKDSIFAFSTTSIIGVDLDQQKFKTLYDPAKYRPTFYEVIGTLDNKTVLKHYSVKMRPGVVNPMTQQKQTPDRLIHEHSYYITNNKGGLQELKLKKRHILKLFDDSAKKVHDFVSENNLSYKKDEDLRKIFTFYKNI